MTVRRSRLTTPALLGRLWRSSPAASAAVALTVLASAALAAAAPRALEVLFTEELHHAVNAVGPTQRDLVAVGTGLPALGPGGGDLPDGLDGTFGAMEDALVGIRESMGHTLESIAEPGRYVLTSEAVPAARDEPLKTDGVFELRFAIDPRMSLIVEPIEGTPPDPVVDGEPVGVWLSVASADALGWAVGESRTIPTRTGPPVRVVLSGTFDAVDPDATQWQHVTGLLEPAIFDDGNAPPRITGMGYLDPTAHVTLEQLGGQVVTTVWFPLDPSTLRYSDAEPLLADLRGFTAVGHALASGVTLGQVAPLNFREGVVGAVDAVLGRSTATTAVVALVAAGPFGVAIAVLALATRLVAVRRQPGLALAAARGGSEAQLRGAMAIEGALLGLPAAALGIAVAVVAIPGPIHAPPLLPAVVLGAAPAVLFAAAWRRSTRDDRGDLDTRPAWRFRWILEVLVVGLSLAATVLLFTRGLVGGRGSAVVDPLLVATPLLLALAACVVVLRLFPLPLAAISRGLARGDGVVGPIGSMIALRSAAVPIAPVLAILVGVAIALFSTVIVATIDRGAEQTADAVVGADLRVEGVTGGSDAVASIAALEGVAAVAGIDDAGPASLRVDGVREPITLVIVDAAALGALRDETVQLGETTADGSIPVLVSGDLLEEAPADLELTVEGEAVTVVGLADPVTGLVATSRWVMADASAARVLAGAEYRPTSVLVRLDPGADTTAIAERIAELGGSRTRISTPDSVLAQLRASPVVAGLRIALVIASSVAALLAALALLLASVAGARARRRVLSLLSTLGLSVRQSGGLAAWELAPTAIVSTVVGAALGLTLPFVVLAAVDLQPFTGGGAPPEVVVPWPAVGGILAGSAIAVVLAILAVTAASRRASAAATLRMGDEPT